MKHLTVYTEFFDVASNNKVVAKQISCFKSYHVWNWFLWVPLHWSERI